MMDEGRQLNHQIHTTGQNKRVGLHVLLRSTSRYIIYSRLCQPIIHSPLRTRRRLGVSPRVQLEEQGLTTQMAAER